MLGLGQAQLLQWQLQVLKGQVEEAVTLLEGPAEKGKVGMMYRGEVSRKQRMMHHLRFASRETDKERRRNGHALSTQIQDRRWDRGSASLAPQ